MSAIYSHWHFLISRHVDDHGGSHDAVRMTTAAKNYERRRSQVLANVLPIGCWEHLDTLMFEERMAELRGADAREYRRLMRLVDLGGEDVTIIPPESDEDAAPETIQERMARLGISRSTEFRRRQRLDQAA